MSAAHVLLAGLLLATAAAASPADEKLGRLMEQARARSAGVEMSAPSAERVREREALLAQGEAALAARDAEAAQRSFDRAASILHAADSEMGLVRAYMQGGEYRRALAFVAHTAAAHRQAAGGAALYAWLLHAGGQREAAKRLLDEAHAQLPGDPVLVAIGHALQQGTARTEPLLLQPPARLAPYGSLEGVPAGARVAGTGVLVDGGRRALVPLATVEGARRVWVRNALGALARATIERSPGSPALVVLRLDAPLPAATELARSARDPFPGSIAYTVEYAAGEGPAPAWPLLSTGFLGPAFDGGARRELGITLPEGARGGPVFDAMGRLSGIALRTRGVDHIVPVSRWPEAAREPPGVPAPAGASRVPVDQVYESSLRTALQVIVTRAPGTSRTLGQPRP